MRKVTIIMSIICAMVVAACQETAEEKQNKLKKNTYFVDDDITKYMHYVQDPRTSLCFARSTTRGGYYVYSPIKCTPRIEKFLLNRLQ